MNRDKIAEGYSVINGNNKWQYCFAGSTECEQVRSESRMGYIAVPFVE